MAKSIENDIDTTAYSESMKKLMVNQMIDSMTENFRKQIKMLFDSVDKIMLDKKIKSLTKSTDWMPSPDTIPGVGLILNERERQVKELGYTSEHDDNHTENFLALEAIRYATPNEDSFLEDRIDDLVKAGALIAAEIDRLQRLKP